MSRLKICLDKIDTENKKDPNHEVTNGLDEPKEYIYSIRMTEWLNKLVDNPNELLQIAARGQHIARWTSPRENYPMGKAGYLKWRTELYKFHAGKVAQIMEESGYLYDEIEKVKKILQKKELKSDEDVQAIEDVACLVFLNYYLEDMVIKTSEEKIVSILQKTWNKMSEKAKALAKEISYSEECRMLIEKI
ncbi:MAG: DUF4202 domain-containing protein [Leptospiraceae bacterium]|nr:DUF4202 domain-containing protein [Leptospiraceae bacterium]MCP5497708.1 DUF4202 domain-containing protein [Leptospiraceae bacterium]